MILVRCWEKERVHPVRVVSDLSESVASLDIGSAGSGSNGVYLLPAILSPPELGGVDGGTS